MNESSPTSADMEPQSSPEADKRRVNIRTTSTNAPTNNKTWFIFRLLASLRAELAPPEWRAGDKASPPHLLASSFLRLFASSPFHWPDIALVIILALLPCLFFWRLITPNPADRMVITAGDFTEQYFP